MEGAGVYKNVIVGYKRAVDFVIKTNIKRRNFLCFIENRKIIDVVNWKCSDFHEIKLAKTVQGIDFLPIKLV